MNSLFSIENKLAVVTGGTRGIGYMIAKGFLQAGAEVIVSSRKADVCAEVEKDLSEIGPIKAIPLDLSTEQGCFALGDAVEEIAGGRGLDILVNNAGANWGAPMEEFPDAAWDRVLNLNLRAPFTLTKRLLPLLKKAGSAEEPARVINIGSIDGLRVPGLDTFSYSTSKAGVHHLTRVLAQKLAPEITVNAIAPGPFESQMMAATLEAMGDEIRAMTPLKRIGRPDDMAGMAIFLASRAGSYLTGTVIPVDGGISST
jgi:NAD(P)-dependent dehydrogenase (short-subunit alcohol dehydrogenase family)